MALWSAVATGVSGDLSNDRGYGSPEVFDDAKRFGVVMFRAKSQGFFFIRRAVCTATR